VPHYVLRGEESMPTALLSRLQRWAEFTPAEIALVQDLPGQTIAAQRGDILPLDLRDGGSLIMLDCWAATFKDAPSGRRVITEYILPGELYEVSRFKDRTTNVLILSRGQVRLVPHSDMRGLYASERLGEALDWMAAIRASISREWLANIAARKAHERLAHLLSELSVRLNAAGLLHDAARAEMPLTQMDLASSLAMSNVHLNNALQRLRSGGMVDIRDKHLVILNRDHLDAVAGFDDTYLLQWPTRLPDRRSNIADRRVQRERRRSPHLMP